MLANIKPEVVPLSVAVTFGYILLGLMFVMVCEGAFPFSCGSSTRQQMVGQARRGVTSDLLFLSV